MKITLDVDNVILFSLLFIRVSSVMMTAPLLGSSSVPPRVKLGLGLILSFLFLPLAGSGKDLMIRDSISLSLAAGKEVLVGVALGFIANLVFAGINLAGQLMGFQMGFAIANVMDPISQTSVSIISHFVGFLALVLFVTLNGHYWFIEAIADSFRLVPLGYPMQSSIVAGNIMNAAGEIFEIGLKIGAPVFAILIFANVGLGIVARTVPQMNVFIVGFPLTIGLGLITVGLALPLFYEVARESFAGIGRDIYVLLRGM